MPIPSAASEINQPARAPPEISAAGFGQYGNNAIAMLSDNTIRAGFDRELTPGIGTNTKMPATRASVIKNPRIVEVERTSSPRIAAQVPQNRNRVRRHLREHPRQGQQKRPQKCHQPRNGAEARVLDRG